MGVLTGVFATHDYTTADAAADIWTFDPLISSDSTIITANVVNRSNQTAYVDLFIVNTADETALHYVEQGVELPPRGVLTRSSLGLAAGDTLKVNANVANLSVVVWGSRTGYNDGESAGSIAVPAVDTAISHNAWTGNGLPQVISHGLDYSAGAWMTWIMDDNNAGNDTVHVNSVTGPVAYVDIDNGPRVNDINTITQTTANSYTVGSTFSVNSRAYKSLDFKRADRTVDIITWNGNSTSDTEIAHNLGVTPAWVFIQGVLGSSAGAVNWSTNTATLYQINGYASADAGRPRTEIFTQLPTAERLTLSNSYRVNADERTYVALLIANDQTGNVATGTISAGSDQVIVNLGYEVDLLMWRNLGGSGSWQILGHIDGANWNATNGQLSFASGTTTTNGFIQKWDQANQTGFATISGQSRANAIEYLAFRAPAA